MTVEDMKRYKKEKGYTMAQLSEHSGVPVGTIQKIFTGETKCPRYDTLQALERTLLPERSRVIREALAEYGIREGNYTIEDYYELPDEQRVELIDGTFYDLAASSIAHQLLATELGSVLSQYIRKNRGECIVFSSPIDVQLDCDDKTMLEPDLTILCDRSKLREKNICGAPDFVIEILSPSTAKKDLTVKLQKYAAAGVREYWMIDISREKVITYFFEEEVPIPVIYSFESEVPVRIYEDDLKINFAELKERLKGII